MCGLSRSKARVSTLGCASGCAPEHHAASWNIRRLERVSTFRVPRVCYAKSHGVNIAYQVLGDGPMDLVHVPPFISNLELQWEDPAYAKYMQRLASFSRLIMFDKRGTGLSDR